jgi:hypothetical protein
MGLMWDHDNQVLTLGTFLLPFCGGSYTRLWMGVDGSLASIYDDVRMALMAKRCW